MTATRSERTRVVADLAWLSGLTLAILGLALLVTPEAPIVAASFAIVAGSIVAVSGALLLNGVPTSWTFTTFAFVLAIGSAAYAVWVATPYWWGAVAGGVLALVGLVVEWTDHPPRDGRSPRGATR